MEDRYFRLRFDSDIVLNASSNTEGNTINLDFVTGSSILGIIAKEFGDDEDFVDTFLSGKVRFMEASPLGENGAICYKMPFSFFKPKLNDDKYFNNHCVDYEDKEIEVLQLKQQREGYIYYDKGKLNKANLEYEYRQKSSYDPDSRRSGSSDSNMFGYRAIKKGMVWVFRVRFVDEHIKKEKIIKALLGNKRLGKSKNSEYGKVYIEEYDFDGSKESVENRERRVAVSYLYVNSSLALFTNTGMPTFEINKENLGIRSGEILMDNTQIRTKTFSPYNSKRKGRDSTRLVIEKGSVIAIKDLAEEDEKRLKEGVGAFLNEGYGDILVNPEFLFEKEFSLGKGELLEEIKRVKREEDSDLVAFLKERKDREQKFESIHERVKKTLKKPQYLNKNISDSQWGYIRVLLQVHDDYKEKIEKYISKGVKASAWDNIREDFLSLLENEENLEFIKLLVVTIPKEKAKECQK